MLTQPCGRVDLHSYVNNFVVRCPQLKFDCILEYLGRSTRSFSGSVEIGDTLRGLSERVFFSEPNFHVGIGV